MSQYLFCKREQISTSTFSYWLKKYRQNGDGSGRESSQTVRTFIPLELSHTIPSRNMEVVPSNSRIEISCPNGFHISCPVSMDIRQLKTLIDLQAMFTLSSSNRFHLYSQPTDMRKSFDGLSGMIQNTLESNPCNGTVFIFINKRRDKIKLLHWQGISFTLYYKRLEKGTFELPEYDPQVGRIVLSYTQIVMLVDGLTIKNIHKRKRYLPNIQDVFYPIFLLIISC